MPAVLLLPRLVRCLSRPAAAPLPWARLRWRCSRNASVFASQVLQACAAWVEMVTLYILFREGHFLFARRALRAKSRPSLEKRHGGQEA